MHWGHDHTVWLLGSLCGLQRLQFDARALLQRYPPPHSFATLIEAGRELGFRFARAPVDRRTLGRLNTPCIARLRLPAAGTVEQPGHPILLLRVDDERVLFFESGSARPRQMGLEEALQQLQDSCYLVTAEPATPATDAAVDPAPATGWRWFAAEMLKYRAVWWQVLAASVVLQAIGLCTPLFTQVMVDKVVVHQTMSTFKVIIVAMVVFMLFSTAMGWLRQYLIVHTGNRIDAVLGSRLFAHLLHLPMPYFEQRPTGTIAARLHAIETVREFLCGAAVSLIVDLPLLALFFGVMVWYSWLLAMAALGILLMIAVASIVVGPLMRTRLNRQFLAGARQQAFVTEHVAAMETVKALQMEGRMRDEYDARLAEWLGAGFASRQLANGFGALIGLLEQSMTLVVLGLGAWLVMRNDGFTIGMLVAFQMFAARLSQPVLRLSGLWQEFQQACIAVQRLGDILDAPAEPHSLRSMEQAPGRGRIVLENLAFAYSAQARPLYEGLSTTIEPGELVMISGPSGCGKSTLARLLLGFYLPSGGRILLDGRDIRHLSASRLREHFGVVPQQPVLFSGTLCENLQLACPQATREEMVAACAQAGIHEHIQSLPLAYDTRIGEQGTGLSGGQKQRLAIARAILRRPSILIFDEATSSLDEATAAQIARTINRIKGGMTVLFIAHQVPAGLKPDREIRLGQ